MTTPLPHEDRPHGLTMPRGLLALRLVTALVCMAVGAFGALFLLHWMNEANEQDDDQALDRQTRFELPPQPPPPRPEPKPKPKPRPRKVARSAAPPPPAMGGALGGLSLDLPGFSSADLNFGDDREMFGDARAEVMTADTVDKQARITRRVTPRYPARAARERTRGCVKIKIFIGPDGRLVEHRIVKADPPGVFEEAVIQAITAQSYEAAVYNGEPVGQWQELRYPFGGKEACS